ncbi:MAG TPA: hypothetical protein ENN99_02705 [Chloroflexi bacterium]|nr:hypothetical protein [Chloroflexota bacterium]
MENSITLEEALAFVRQLSPVDKARLIERIAPDIERELASVRPVPRKSLRGLWKKIDITAEDIDQARREMWGSFPREGI